MTPAAIRVASTAGGFWFKAPLLTALMLFGAVGSALAMGTYLAVTWVWLRAHGNDDVEAPWRAPAPAKAPRPRLIEDPVTIDPRRVPAG